MTRFDSKSKGLDAQIRANINANPDLRVITDDRLRPEPRTRRRPRELESQMQRAVIAECNRRAEYDPRWAMVLSIPNGGMRNKATAGRMKAEGVKAGVPDLHLPIPCRGYHSMWCELKISPNKPTAVQQEWIDFLQNQGHFVAVIWDDPDMAIGLIEWYLEGESC